jgi:hypothetical protein
MKKISSLLLTLLTLCAFAPTNTGAQTYLELSALSPYTHYKTFETAHFVMTYAEGYLDFTQKAAEYLEQAHSILSPILKWQPRQKTSILVADNADSANGFTSPALRIGIVLIATPPDVNFSTVYSDDWIKLLVFHEYTHMLNIDATTHWIEALRIIFGDGVRPNGLWPVWMLEGLAVYYETRTSKLGRGRSPYYDSILRADLLEHRLDERPDFGITLDRVNGDFPFFPGGEIPYLFGYHLWDQFAIDRKKDSDMGEYSIRSAGRFPYLIEGNLKNITHGKVWKDYWNAFVKESKTRFEPQFEAIRAAGVTPTEQVTHAKDSAEGGALSPNGRYLAFNETTLDERENLYIKDNTTGEVKSINDKLSGLGMSFTPDSRFLIYSSLVRTGTYSLYSDLFAYDVQKDKITQLSAGARLKDPSVSPDGKSVTFIKIGVATNDLGEAELAQQDGTFILKNVRAVHVPSAYSIIGTPRYLSNDEIIFSLQERQHAYSDLVAFSNSTGKVRTVYHDAFMNRFPLPVSDNKGNQKLYFVSDKTGVENLYELTSASSAKPASNVLTGLVMPFSMDSSGKLYASLMTSNGYEIVKFMPETPAPFKTEMRNTPAAPETLAEALKEAPSLHPNPTEYTPWKSLLPRSWSLPIPYVTNGTNSGTSVGAYVLGFDTTGKQQYTLTGVYNDKVKTFDGNLDYTFYYFRPQIDVGLQAYTSDIATGPNFSQFKRGYQASLALTYPILFTYSSIRPRVYGFMDWNGLYDVNTKQKISTYDFEYQNPRVPGLGASITFSDAETSLLGFMNERGNDVTLAVEDRVNLYQYSVVKYLAGYTHYFKFGEHSVLMPRARYLASSYLTPNDRSYALIDGKNYSNIFDQGTNLSLGNVGIRGYQNETIYSKAVAIGSLDYFFPVHEWFSGIHNTVPVFFKQMFVGVFGECAYRPYLTRAGGAYLPSFGGSLSLDTTLLIRVPLRFIVEFQNGTNKDFGGGASGFFALSSPGLF